ncbi:MAG: tRNA (adenine-N1)-methyltransferase [Deferribacterales bacterium]
MAKLEYGSLAFVIDEVRGKRHLLRMKEGVRFSTQFGFIDHEDIIAAGDGGVAYTQKGVAYRVFYPTYSDYVMNIKRRAQIIYPKDSAAIIMSGDIHGDQRVLESGVGQGAMSIALLHALGGKGQLTSYEIREDFAMDAAKFIGEYYGDAPNHSIEIRSVYEGIDGEFDRIVLDLPEPWHVVKHCDTGLVNGGLIVCYLPTIIQAVTLVEHLKASGYFEEIETFEITKRPWKIDGRSVRPEMWTYNHSAFLIKARKVVPMPVREIKREDVSDKNTEPSEPTEYTDPN